jgi:hypothetical protein
MLQGLICPVLFRDGPRMKKEFLWKTENQLRTNGSWCGSRRRNLETACWWCNCHFNTETAVFVNTDRVCVSQLHGVFADITLS